MITLSTLPQATAQQVFDQVVEHLRKQRRKSRTPDGACKYHGANGLKCAAGIFISDSEYNESFEGYDWRELVSIHFVTGHHRNLILKLQNTHDGYAVDKWEEQFQSIAKQFNLTYTPIR